MTRDKVWLWAHEAGSHNRWTNLPGVSRITPAEAARSLGIHNVVMVAFGNRPEPPFHAHALPLSEMRRLVWSIVGDASSPRSDLDAVLDLASSMPNLCGGIMDDFFQKDPASGKPGRTTPAEVAAFASRLHDGPRRLDLWVVLYDHELDLPVRAHLESCDVVTFWTWKARDLGALEANLGRLEALAPDKRRLLGVYLWNYGENAAMPPGAVELQLDRAARLVDQGRLEGVILLGSPICDLDIEAVRLARRWVQALPEE